MPETLRVIREVEIDFFLIDAIAIANFGIGDVDGVKNNAVKPLHGQLIPLLVWCSRFRLQADCVVDGRRLVLQLATGDPIFPASAPRQLADRTL